MAGVTFTLIDAALQSGEELARMYGNRVQQYLASLAVDAIRRKDEQAIILIAQRLKEVADYIEGEKQPSERFSRRRP